MREICSYKFLVEGRRKRNMTDTGNRARKTSGTQGKEDPASVPELEVLQKCVLMNLRLRRGSDILTLPRQPE